jgi:hypothetical protein
MVHFPGLARTRLYIQRAVSRVHRDGFPHSEIPGSKPACGSPGLIAACHVLLRLLAPRHPPYALSSLTIKLTQHVALRYRVPLRGRDTFGRFVPSKLAFPSSTIRSARAELAVLRDTLPPSRTRSEKSRAIASLFSCQRAFSPRPAERPHSSRP